MTKFADFDKIGEPKLREEIEELNYEFDKIEGPELQLSQNSHNEVKFYINFQTSHGIFFISKIKIIT